MTQTPPTELPASLIQRDPAPMLQAALREHRRLCGSRAAIWVFGYASLIWNPAFEPAERRAALVHGWHRSLGMRSCINRGSPERPGLVCALLPGGACRGVVLRLPQGQRSEVLAQLWDREMITGVYDPRWLACHTPQGVVPALAFTLARRSPSHVGTLPDGPLLEVLRHARGRYGTTLEYLANTHRGLLEHGIRDRELERMVQLAARHGLPLP